MTFFCKRTLSVFSRLALIGACAACSKGTSSSESSDGGSGGGTGDGDGTGGETGGDGDGTGTGGLPSGEPGTGRLLNVETGEFDPRFSEAPASISTVELLPRSTLQVTPPTGTSSVGFSVAGENRVDSQAPFRLSETSEGQPEAWSLGVGMHSIEVTYFASTDGTGDPIETTTIDFEITAAGTDTTPAEGEHSQHKVWIGADSSYDTTSGEFAFMVLLPEGYDPSVKYPVLTFLHHGDANYRGIDNNGLPLTTSPLFTGSRAIHSSQTRLDHPAIVLIPQLIGVEEIDGVTNEWAAFHSLDNATGDYDAGPEPSVSASHVFRVLDDMRAGTFMVDGQVVSVDSGRIYLAGHSMGGFGTWDFLWRRADLWAAGVPMAGYQDHESAALLVDIPIWCFHHEIDSYNPFHSDTMQSLIEAAGGTKMRLTQLTFDTGGAGDQAHFRTPNAAWNDEPGLFTWIFSQVRARD